MSTIENGRNGVQGVPEVRPAEELAAENARLREEVARLQAELCDLARLREAVTRLEREKAEIDAEREGYRKSLQALMPEDLPITQEEIDDLDRNGIPFDEKFVEELERDLRSLGPFDA